MKYDECPMCGEEVNWRSENREDYVYHKPCYQKMLTQVLVAHGLLPIVKREDDRRPRCEGEKMYEESGGSHSWVIECELCGGTGKIQKKEKNNASK